MLQQLSSSQVSAEVPVNENFETLFAAAIFGKKQSTTSGLIWGYYGGYFRGNLIADGTVTQTNAATNYIVVERATGIVSVSTTDTDSLDLNYAKLYTNVCAGGVVTVEGDRRWDDNGLFTQGSSGPNSTQTGEMITGYISTVANKTYRFVVKAAHAGTITEVTTISESGTCTATFKINSTALGGTANAVSSSEQTQAQASDNAWVAGDDLQLTTSANAACIGLTFTIKYTRVYD